MPMSETKFASSQKKSTTKSIPKLHFENRLLEYDTPAQVGAVILELKAAIKRGDEEFTFPTVEDLSEPAHISEALAEIPAIQKILAQRSLTA